MKRTIALTLIVFLLFSFACGPRTPMPSPTGTAIPPTSTPAATSTPASTSTPTMIATSTAIAALTPSLPAAPRPSPVIAEIPTLQGIVLLWHLTGGIAGFCDDLAAFENGQLIYGRCGGAAKGSLPEGQLAQLRNWQGRYYPFEYQFQDNPGKPDNMTTTLIFSGKGTAMAAEADQKEIVNWARQLYAELAKQQRPTATPAGQQTITTEKPPPLAVALQTFQGPGFSLPYPTDAAIKSERENAWRLVGPVVAVRPVTGGGTWSLPGYMVDIVLYDNPKGAGSSAWAREYLVNAWQEARGKKEPFTGPVNEPGKIVENRVTEVRLGDKAAFQADFLSGDVIRRAVYLSLKNKTVAFFFDLLPSLNYPLAEVASDIYGLLLSQASAPGAEGAARTIPAAQGVREFIAPGFVIFGPANATLQEAEANHWELVGPEVAIRPADADWMWQGPAYRLDLVLHDNPKGLGAVEWAEQHLLAEWKRAKEANEPFTGPVDAQGRFREGATARVQVGGAPGYRADWFGGDRLHRVIYVKAASKVLAVHYDIVPAANHPAAPLANTVHALLLATLRPAP